MEKEVTVTVPANTDKTPDNNTPSTDKTSNGSDNDSGAGFSIVWLLIGIVIGGAVGTGVMFVVSKKKRV